MSHTPLSGGTRGAPSRAGGWGPVLSGATAAFITFEVFSSLWLAVAASGANAVANALEWLEFATALIAAAVGGFVAGWLDGRGGIGGALQGLATWGLVIFAGLIVSVPSGAAIFAGATNLTLQSVTTGGNVVSALHQVSGELWATFAILIGGAIVAAVTGMLAGRRQADRVREAAYTDEVVVEGPRRG